MLRIGRISAVAARFPAGKRAVSARSPQTLSAVLCQNRHDRFPKHGHSTARFYTPPRSETQLKSTPRTPRELDYVLQRHDNFAERHIGPRPEDLNDMLDVVGVKVR